MSDTPQTYPDSDQLDPGLVRYKDFSSGQVMVMTLEQAKKAASSGHGRILAATEVAPAVTPFESFRQTATSARVYATVTNEALQSAITKLAQDLPGKGTSISDLVATMVTAYGQGKITLAKIMPIVPSP